jgi:mono/diheme cytochrome c family protein
MSRSGFKRFSCNQFFFFPRARDFFLPLIRRGLASGWVALLAVAAIANASGAGDERRGEYLAKAGGCFGCHTENKKNALPYSGGRALQTPFGTFFGPNITPDPQKGIGRWTEVDFIRAMRQGIRPDRAYYYPAFPYPSFTLIVDGDLRDLWAFLKTLPPTKQTGQAHDLRFPFGWRSLVAFWRWLFFSPGPFTPDINLPPSANRGAYLVQALGHCGECHTPRNLFGGPRGDRFLAGGKGPGGKRVPNLTPTRLKKWDDAELKNFLTTGTTPDGDVSGEAMGEVIRNTTSQLTAEDLGALVVYLRSLPPLPDEPP